MQDARNPCPVHPAASVQWSGVSGAGKWSQSSVTACFVLKSQFCTARPRNAAIWSDVSALILVQLNICMWASFSTGCPRGIWATFLRFLIESKRGHEVKGRKGVRKHQVNGMGQWGHSSIEKSLPKAPCDQFQMMLRDCCVAKWVWAWVMLCLV